MTVDVQRFESVFLETAPWVEDDRFDPDLGFSVPVTELPIAMTTLDDAFLDALDEIDRNRDNTACWRCGDLVGWVFMEGPVTGRLEWVPVGLVRLVSEDAPPTHQDPIRPMCETCAPYVDPFSYREMMRTRRADREAVRAAEEKRDG